MKEKADKLEEAIQAINKQFGKGTVISMDKSTRAAINKYENALANDKRNPKQVFGFIILHIHDEMIGFVAHKSHQFLTRIHNTCPGAPC